MWDNPLKAWARDLFSIANFCEIGWKLWNPFSFVSAPCISKVVGVADPKEFRRKLFQSQFNLADHQLFSDWSEIAARPKFADAVVIATQDQLHEEPCIAFANLGYFSFFLSFATKLQFCTLNVLMCGFSYHILLEKPMAVTESGCRRIAAACEENDVILVVGHVLR